MKLSSQFFKRHTPGSLSLVRPYLLPAYQGLLQYLQQIRSPLTSDACLDCFGSVESVEKAFVQEQLAKLNQQESVNFVQIGSNDGKTGDPLFRFASKEAHWRGILVEPVGYVYRRLLENYQQNQNHHYVQAIISDDPANVKFYFLGQEAWQNLDDLPSYADQLGGFSPAHITRSLGEKVRPYVTSEEIQALSVPELLKRHPLPKVDLIHIDVEGHDWKVLQGFDLQELQPKIILVEHAHVSYWECRKMLLALFKADYRVYQANRDLIALAPSF